MCADCGKAPGKSRAGVLPLGWDGPGRCGVTGSGMPGEGAFPDCGSSTNRKTEGGGKFPGGSDPCEFTGGKSGGGGASRLRGTDGPVS